METTEFKTAPAVLTVEQRIAARYPDCPSLGSDAAELMAFVLHLGLIAGLIRDGHTEQCAKDRVWACADCRCGKDPQ